MKSDSVRQPQNPPSSLESGFFLASSYFRVSEDQKILRIWRNRVLYVVADVKLTQSANIQ